MCACGRAIAIQGMIPHVTLFGDCPARLIDMTFFEWFRAALLLILLCEDRHEFLTALRWIRDLRREMSAFNETLHKLEDPPGRYDHAGLTNGIKD